MSLQINAIFSSRQYRTSHSQATLLLEYVTLLQRFLFSYGRVKSFWSGRGRFARSSMRLGGPYCTIICNANNSSFFSSAPGHPTWCLVHFSFLLNFYFIFFVLIMIVLSVVIGHSISWAPVTLIVPSYFRYNFDSISTFVS